MFLYADLHMFLNLCNKFSHYCHCNLLLTITMTQGNIAGNNLIIFLKMNNKSIPSEYLIVLLVCLQFKYFCYPLLYALLMLQFMFNSRANYLQGCIKMSKGKQYIALPALRYPVTGQFVSVDIIIDCNNKVLTKS